MCNTRHRGVEQLEARRAHNPEVVGSSPASATKENTTQTGGVFFGYGCGLEEGGLAAGKAKKCPVDTFLARGRVHGWQAASGTDVDCHPFFCAPGYESDERSSPRKRLNRRRIYRAPQTGTGYRSPEKLPVGRKSSPASATRLSRHSGFAMTTFYLVFVELLV